MKIYVAGSFHEKELVRTAQQQLRDWGHSITYDWTVHTDEQENTDAKRQVCAEADMAGVRNADAVIVLPCPTRSGVGRWWEAGGAAILGKPILILGPLPGSIFHHLPNVFLVQDLSTALQLLPELLTGVA